MSIRIVFAKVMLKTVGKILPNKGFRKVRTHWARLISKNISKKANVSKAAFITGDGTNLFIGDYAAIGIRCTIDSNLTIGAGTIMGPDCLILTNNHHYDLNQNRLIGMECNKVSIGEKCWIGARCIILPGAKIGNHCIVGAGSVVTNKEFPDYSLIAGNPATIKKPLKK